MRWGSSRRLFFPPLLFQSDDLFSLFHCFSLSLFYLTYNFSLSLPLIVISKSRDGNMNRDRLTLFLSLCKCFFRASKCMKECLAKKQKKIFIIRQEIRGKEGSSSFSLLLLSSYGTQKPFRSQSCRQHSVTHSPKSIRRKWILLLRLCWFTWWWYWWWLWWHDQVPFGPILHDTHGSS